MLEKQWVQHDEDVLSSMLGSEMQSNNSSVCIEHTSLASTLFATILIQNLKSQLETQKNKGG